MHTLRFSSQVSTHWHLHVDLAEPVRYSCEGIHGNTDEERMARVSIRSVVEGKRIIKRQLPPVVWRHECRAAGLLAT